MSEGCDSPLCDSGGATPTVLETSSVELSFCDLHCLTEYIVVEHGDTHELAVETAGGVADD